jgi:hypothetical protein
LQVNEQGDTDWDSSKQHSQRPSRAAKLIALRHFQIDEDESISNSGDEDETSDSDVSEFESDSDSNDGECGQADNNDDNAEENNGEIEEDAPQQGKLDGVYIGKTGERWASVAPPAVGRTNGCNVLRPAPGVTTFAASRIRGDPILDSFFLIFSMEMERTILFETNRQATKISGETWQEIDTDEMLAFLGLILLRGVYKASGESVDELWSKEHGRQIFSQTMPLSRFKAIRRHLRFDNPDTRTARLARDKLAAVRLLIDGFVINSQCALVPNESVTVDEQLYPYRGRCPFTQYMPSKPSKYGLKFWLLCDSTHYFCYNLHLYIGKEDRPKDVGLGEHVVLELARFLFGSGRNITTDNFFTSLALARQLKSKQLTLVGTVRNNRREVPKSLTDYHHRELYSSTFVFTEADRILLVSYKAKPSKIILLLSSQHQDASVSVEKKMKPKVIEYYNHTKGGVDALDERVGTYTTKFATRRWPVVVFCNLLDISAFNAHVLHTLVCPEWNRQKSHRRRLFLIELGNKLSQPHRDRNESNKTAYKNSALDGPIRGEKV